MKEIFATIAIILSFVGYIPYILDIIKGKTQPHIYSWLVWGLITIIAFALQISEGGGSGSYVTLAAAIITFIIFFLGLKNGKKDITSMDTLFFVLSLVSILIWVLAKQAVISAILLSVITIIAFIPTIRKSWNKPYEETLFTWELNTFRHGLSILALEQYNLVTTLYPALWVFANGLFSIMIIIRRRRLK